MTPPAAPPAAAAGLELYHTSRERAFHVLSDCHDRQERIHMASMLGSKTARASLLSLPPHLRAHAYQQSQRQFSASAPKKSLVENVVQPFTGILDILHTTGLPWYAVIPLSAVVARGVIVYYVSALPSRRAAQTHALLLPVNNTRIILENASERMRKAREQDEEALERAGYSSGAKAASAMWMGARSWRIRRGTLHELGKQFGAPFWHVRDLVGFGMLIAMTEAIRVKAGAREGLLPLILHPLQSLGEGVAAFVKGPNELQNPTVKDEGADSTAASSQGVDVSTKIESGNAVSLPTPDQLASSDPTVSSAAQELQSAASVTQDRSPIDAWSQDEWDKGIQNAETASSASNEDPQQGLWNWTQSLFKGKANTAERTTTTDAAPLEPVEETTPNVTTFEWTPTTTTSPDQLASSDPTLSSTAEAAQSSIADATSTATEHTPEVVQLLAPARHFDPTMQTEGFSFSLDLTQPDPTLAILPGTLMLLMMSNVWASAIAAQRLRQKAEAAAPPPPTPAETTTNTTTTAPPSTSDPLLKDIDPEAARVLSAPQKPPRKPLLSKYIPPLTNLQRLQLWLAMFFYVVTIKMPAGIVLYMISSQVVGRAQRWWLDRTMPVRQGIAPCKRPLRLRSRRDWED